MSRVADALRAGAVFTLVAPLLLMATVGAVATVAELQGTWTWYLQMERVIASFTPLTLSLVGVAFVALVGVVAVVDY